MTYQVLKFGGSSVADFSKLAQTFSIIQETTMPTVVVFSAMGGITDTLENLAHAALAGNRTQEKQHLDSFYQRHEEVISQLIDEENRDELISYLKDTVKELHSIFSGIEVLGELTPKSLAKVVSVGERSLAKIASVALHKVGVCSVFLDACEIIQLTKEHDQLVPDLTQSHDLTNKNLIPLLRDNKTVIVPGFIGRGPEGEVSTLGRGGSDYSATLIASLIDAEAVYLYKEVDGLLTSDPRHVSNARVVPELHYREAAELAFYGAKILHPRSIIPLTKKRIPLIIRNTFKPNSPGTLIGSDISPGAYPVKALTAISGQAVVSVEGKGMLGVPGIAARTFGALANEGISVSLITQASSEASICFVVQDKQSNQAKRALSEVFKYELEHSLIDEVKVIEKQSVIALVGLGMSGTYGIAARAFQCLNNGTININAIAQGSSELNISIVINEDHQGSALRLLHNEYCLDRIRALHSRDSGEAHLLIHGFGQIGQELTRQVESQKSYLQNKLGIKAPIVSLIDSSAIVSEQDGLSSQELKDALEIKQSGQTLSQQKGSRSIHDLSKHLAESTYHRGVFVDLTASDSANKVKEALEHGFHVALANKKPLAIPYEDYQELFKIAQSKGVYLKYEATVGAGLPILDTFEKLSETGDDILEVLGCFSGTLGFLMTEIEDGLSFSKAVKKAFDLGYTEPDPREDLSGMDVARKALILARTLGEKINIEEIALEPLFSDDLSHEDPNIFIQNLEQLDQSWRERIESARAQNKVLRYVARLEKGVVKVGIEQVDSNSSLGSLRGTANQICIRTTRYNDNPLILTGPGAGADVTAAGVLNDIISIAVSQERV